jgi:hypothetical protein
MELQELLWHLVQPQALNSPLVCIRVLQCSEKRIFVGRSSNRCLWDGAVLLAIMAMQLRSDLHPNEHELVLMTSCT